MALPAFWQLPGDLVAVTAATAVALTAGLALALVTRLLPGQAASDSRPAGIGGVARQDRVRPQSDS